MEEKRDPVLNKGGYECDHLQKPESLDPSGTEGNTASGGLTVHGGQGARLPPSSTRSKRRVLRIAARRRYGNPTLQEQRLTLQLCQETNIGFNSLCCMVRASFTQTSLFPERGTVSPELDWVFLPHTDIR
ncbi:hypothetical protein STEG23_005308 [Scotinomys teguina]